MPHLILAVNPGSTSTKIGLFRDEEQVFVKSIEHDTKELEQYDTIIGQKAMRSALVLEALRENGVEASGLSAAVGRGGLFPPMLTGGYVVDQKMKDMIISGVGVSPHASNLGALIAADILPGAAYIYDAVSASDMPETAKITGFPEIKRQSFSHVLNCRAMGIKYAKTIGKSYDELNLITAHLGGGTSVSAHLRGKIVESCGDDYGAFSPERSGGLPLLLFLDMCFDGGYTRREVQKKVRGKGGLVAYFGTTDCRKIEAMIQGGDEKAALVYDAMAYNIAKTIASMAPALNGKIDAVILTGGVARSKLLCDKITEYTSFLAPVEVLPGENELEALAMGGLRIIRGEETANVM